MYVEKEGFGLIELFGLIAFTVSFSLLHFVAKGWNDYSELSYLFMILTMMGIGSSLLIAASMWRRSRKDRPLYERNDLSPDYWRDDSF